MIMAMLLPGSRLGGSIRGASPDGYTVCELPAYLYNEDEIQFVFNYCFHNLVVLNHLPMVF